MHTRGSGASDPAARGRHGDAHARRPHQAVPRGRPSCRIGCQRPARRRDGRRDHGEGQQRDRTDDRASPQVGRRAPSHRGARSRARRERLGLQPRRCRCRARSGTALHCRRYGLWGVQRRRACCVLRVPRMVELPATDGGPHAGPPQAGGGGVRPHEHAGCRQGSVEHGHQSSSAGRPEASPRTPANSQARSGTTRHPRRAQPRARTTRPEPEFTTSVSACRAAVSPCSPGQSDQARARCSAPCSVLLTKRRSRAMCRGTAELCAIAPRS